MTDGLGSTVGLCDGSGTVVATYAYDAFGIIRAQTGSSSNYWLFTGEQRDSESGYDYLRARYYDSNVGRFLGQDAAAPDWQAPVTINRFAYALNNPVLYTDPTGRCTFDCAGYVVWDGEPSTAGLADMFNWVSDTVANSAEEIADVVVAAAETAAETAVDVGSDVAAAALDLYVDEVAAPQNEFIGDIATVVATYAGDDCNDNSCTDVPFIGNDSAITLGDTVLFGDSVPSEKVKGHEQGHLQQTKALDALFYLLYGINMILDLPIPGGDFGYQNVFEWGAGFESGGYNC